VRAEICDLLLRAGQCRAQQASCAP
jgi:hypothetical protein